MAEDETLALESAARLAAQKGLRRFSRFLDPAQAVEAQRIARSCGAEVALWGGYERAERAVACFYPAGDEPQSEDFPVVCLSSAYPARFCSLSHRDLLGAFMALGLTRSCVGDMIIKDERVLLFALRETAPLIERELTSAGRATLRFTALCETPPIPEPEGDTFSAVVSSLRLDAVLAAAYRLSRAEAAERIRAGLVKLDHLPCERVDAQVAEGALLSLRGSGRVRLTQLRGMTKKQRIGVTFFRYE